MTTPIEPQTIERAEPPFAADERTMLDAWLDFHRATLLTKCEGLTEDQLRTRAVPPSSLSLLGLVRHMADVERSWFRRALAGEARDDAPPQYYSDDNPDGEFDDVDTADALADLARYRDEVARCRQVAAVHTDLEALGNGVRDGRRAPMSLRWIYLHMIEEYARHNGHADFLRERIDGVTGV
ncbi:MAG TPA: DinB family protein [Nocardioidaceae bacterium]